MGTQWNARINKETLTLNINTKNKTNGKGEKTMELLKIKNSFKQTVLEESPIRNLVVKTDLKTIRHLKNEKLIQQEKIRKRWELNGLCG